MSKFFAIYKFLFILIIVQFLTPKSLIYAETIKEEYKVEKIFNINKLYPMIINNIYSGICLKKIEIVSSNEINLFWQYQCINNDGMSYKDLKNIDKIVKDEMKKHKIKGLSISFTKDNRLIFARGYGYSDNKGGLVTPRTRFRIASISKSITAAAIMKLIQEKKISLDTYLLEMECTKINYRNSPRCRQNRFKGIFSVKDFSNEIGLESNSYLFKIQIKHLLEHTSGLGRGILPIFPDWRKTGYGSDFLNYLMNRVKNCDQYLYCKEINGKEKCIDKKIKNAKIRCDTVQKGFYPQIEPGKKSAYWNQGYHILGLIIEKITKQSYENYVKGFLKNGDISLFTPGEYNEYYNAELFIESKYFHNQNKPITNEKRLINGLSIGGWVATTSALVKFGNNFNENFYDNFNDLGLSVNTIKRIKTEDTLNANYTKGWIVPWDDGRRWWHNGSLKGTKSILSCDNTKGKRPNTCYSIIINTTIKNSKVFSDIAKRVFEQPLIVNYWPKYDLNDIDK